MFLNGTKYMENQLFKVILTTSCDDSPRLKTSQRCAITFRSGMYGGGDSMTATLRVINNFLTIWARGIGLISCWKVMSFHRENLESFCLNVAKLTTAKLLKFDVSFCKLQLQFFDCSPCLHFVSSIFCGPSH